MLLAAVLGIAAAAICTIVARADQTYPYCSAGDSSIDKYQCATTASYYDNSTGTRTITSYGWNGSLGAGGYNCCWNLNGITVWDSLNGQPHEHAAYGPESGTHSNETYFSGPLAYVFNDTGVLSQSVVYYCFHFHNNAQYIGTQYYPPSDAYGEWRNYPDTGQAYDEGQIGCP